MDASDDMHVATHPKHREKKFREKYATAQSPCFYANYDAQHGNKFNPTFYPACIIMIEGVGTGNSFDRRTSHGPIRR
jgi:hypothetical protein